MLTTRRFLTIAVLLVLLQPHAGAGDRSISAERYLSHLKTLAADGLQGRGNGTAGLELAADYIAEQYRLAGLKPGGVNGTWFQPFEIVTGLEIGPGNRLTLHRNGTAATLELGRSYYPLSVPSEQRPEAADAEDLPLVFAGYGIVAPEARYDDYAGLDVRGRAVVVFTHEPQENDPSSPFDGQALTRHAGVMQKAMVARQHGARILLLVVDPSHAIDQGSYEGWLRDPQAEDYGLPVFRVERSALQSALGRVLDLDAVASAIDGDLRPRSRALDDLRLSAVQRFSRVKRTVRNVIGVLEGAHPRLSREAVVIGAHYDHLGLGGRHSMAMDAIGEVHNGADDNASGTAALLEIARGAAARRERFRRTLVFAAFAGEELGLLGSAHYVENPPVPIERTVAMINLDMIGRSAGRIVLSGLDTAPSLKPDVDAASRNRTVEVRLAGRGAVVASSDDANFRARRVPALAFFSGFHDDYHRPSDDWDKIDVAGATEVARIALDLAERIARRPDRPPFVPQDTSASQTGSPGGYGPYFGSVPDFTESEAGVRFLEVRPGSPADQAGLRRGDILIRFDGQTIVTLHDFTFALRGKQPGDVVKVVVLRNGREVHAEVKLGVRP
ncbi:MAG TPA: M28 family peptidase [Vicinamibacterales bacterium]|nr:M28 family peptidase [Vicinamibacterales bacterium]